MMKNILAILLALALLFGTCAAAERFHVADGSAEHFGDLLIDLLRAYEKPSAGDDQAIASELSAIQKASPEDGELAQAIVDHWNRVYLNRDGTYQPRTYRGEQRAVELEQTALQDSRTHAFVVLGYELKDGKMTSELIGRCDAAAAAARSFPNTILVCSGGPTGKNNPLKHTEAGMMKDYLVKNCGIDAARIFIDEQAMSTVENARNTFEILRAQGIDTITIVTSSYHQRWGQVVYNAVAAIYRRMYGYSVEIVENYSFEIEARGTFKYDARWAVRQLTNVLGLPEKVVNRMKKAI